MRATHLIAAMCLAHIAGMAGVFTFSALLPVFFDEWGISEQQAGWISAVFYLGYMGSVPVLVSLTDRMDPRRIYLVFMVVMVASVAGFPLLADGPWSAMGLRVLAGIGMAGTYMPGLKALSDLVEGQAQSRAVSFYTSSFGIGSAISFYLAGKIGAWQDWQTAFYVAGIGPALALLLVWWVLPANPPRPRQREARLHVEFFEAMRNRRAMAYTLAYMVHNFELFGFRSWLVVFLFFNAGFQPGGQSWISPTTMAFFVTLLALPASVTGNELAVRFGRRRVVCGVMGASAVLACGIGFMAGQPFALVAALTLFYGLTVMGDSSSITAGTIQEAHPDLRGTTMAVHACVGFLGSFLGPLVFGVVLDLAGGRETLTAWGLAFGTMGVVVALGPVFVLTLGRKEAQRQKPAHV